MVVVVVVRLFLLSLLLVVAAVVVVVVVAVVVVIVVVVVVVVSSAPDCETASQLPASLCFSLPPLPARQRHVGLRVLREDDLGAVKKDTNVSSMEGAFQHLDVRGW